MAGGVQALRLLVKAVFSGAVVADCIIFSYLYRIGWNRLGTAWKTKSEASFMEVRENTRIAILLKK